MEKEIKNEVAGDSNTAEVVEEETKQEGKAIISYDDFAKLDITIGTIVSAEIVEDADKLLRLEVDVNEGTPRQIISGIREYFDDIQFLVGKQCPFLTNLQPRTIRGYESQGMILAAENDGVFSLLIAHNELPSGTKVN
ncbi:MAG: methionyl-tRNA synthetase [Acidimicrobiales bacterium]|jgi:methionyl-tRNA synthetase